MINSIKTYLELIRFSHTIFALPFALIAVLIASNGKPSWQQLTWIIIAMVGARSGAMGFNRWVDRHFDALNPRTKNRPSVTGAISPTAQTALMLCSYALLVFAASRLHPLALWLSPVAIFLTSFYSLTKRFTPYSHLFLGLAVGAAAPAAYLALRGELNLAVLILGASAWCWISGFDILYALQDQDFDRQVGLHSLPARWGKTVSLWSALILHALAAMLWFAFGVQAQLGWVFYLAVGACGLLLVLEHARVFKGGKSLAPSWLNINAWVSILLLAGTAYSIWF